MFSDLPSINFDCEHATPYSAYPPLEWQSADPPFMVRTFNTFAVNPSTQPWSRRNIKVQQGFVSQECHGRYMDQGIGQHKSNWSYAPTEFDPNLGVVTPWASGVYPSGETHALYMGSEDSQSSDQGSCSDGSTWSPVLSERQCGSRWNSQIGEYKEPHFSQTFRTSSTFSNPSVGSSSSSSSGITLQDVQQYPDSCPEDEFEKFDLSNDQVAPIFSTEYAVSPRIPCVRDNRIRHLDGPCPNPGNAIAVKDEQMSEEDTDSASDYSPDCHRRHHATRPSRAIKQARTPSNNSRKGSTTDKHRVSKSTRQSIKSSPITHIGQSSKASLHRCPHCPKIYPTKSALNKHVLTIHTRPFSCTFRIYGCPSTFGSKNEWKRHVSSQHLRLGIWRCDMGICLPQQNRPPLHRHQTSSDSDDEETLIFNDFNRKDLFTQHIRRMHAPPESCSPADRAAFDASLEKASKRCLLDIRPPPPRSVCGYCDGDEPVVFEGEGSWEVRMEHVGRHLESGHGESRHWREDVGLRAWMQEERLVEYVRGAWKLAGLQVEEGKMRRVRK